MRKYPYEVVPKATYKELLEFKVLKHDYPNMLVLRMVKGRKEDYYDASSNNKELTDRIFQGSIQNLSMNLLGGKFEIKHHSFLPKNNGASNWDGNNIKLSQYKDSYIDENPAFYICFNVEEIDGKTYPFPNPFNTQEERDSMEKEATATLNKHGLNIDQEIVEKFRSPRDNVNIQVLMKLNHHPTMLNYWHITLDTTRPDNPEYIMPCEKLNSRDKRQMKAFKQHLMELIVDNIDSVPYKFKKKDYLKKVTLWDRALEAFGK